MVFSNASQESYVAQGLALGVLAAGIGEVPADKIRVEFAFNHGWRRQPDSVRRNYPRILGRSAADPYYAVFGRSERRRGPVLAAWDTSENLRPYVCNEGWTVEESGQMLAGWSEVPWESWQSFGADFVAHLEGGVGQ